MPITLLIILFFSVSGFASLKDYRLQYGCALTSLSKEVTYFPGAFCIFLEDGSFISGTEQGLRRFKPDRTIKWEVPGFFHHQINLTQDKKRILAMISEKITRGNLKEKSDVFLIIDLEDGKILHRRSALDILRMKGIVPLDWRTSPDLKKMMADIEVTHFNSIYEIPENSAMKGADYMRPGNIIVNSVGLGVFILSPEFERVLYHKIFSFSRQHQVHDVQVIRSGEFLLFNNVVHEFVPYNYSAIQKYDPGREKLTFTYSPEEKAFFYSPFCGSVQEVDEDYIFFSHVTNGGYLYSRKTKKIEIAVQGNLGDLSTQTSIQQIKIVDVRKFLENSK